LSPILVRPVREQLEHDRVIRLLQAKYKRKTDVAINPGNLQTAAVGPATSPWYPDLVLYAGASGKKLVGVVEVETGESVNHLEAMSQWAALSRLRVPFHLYVPSSSIDSARRLCAEFKISTAEFWAYQVIGEQIRFTMVLKAAGRSKASVPSATPRRAAPPAAARKTRAASTTTARTATAKRAKKKAPAARGATASKTARKAASPRSPKR